MNAVLPRKILVKHREDVLFCKQLLSKEDHISVNQYPIKPSDHYNGEKHDYISSCLFLAPLFLLDILVDQRDKSVKDAN